MKPKNQHQLTLYYLYNWDSFSLKDVINDSMFFKFQTRLSELEKKHGTLATRTKKTFKNRFNRSSDYNEYKAINKNQILNIYNGIKRNN